MKTRGDGVLWFVLNASCNLLLVTLAVLGAVTGKAAQ